MTAEIRRKLDEYRAAIALIRRYGASHVGMLAAFVLLSVFSALTESFGVFLLIPLLQTLGQNNVFASVPLLGHVSAVFESFPPSERLLWAGSLMLVVVLVRGGLQFAQEFVGYVIPHRVDLHLRMRAYSAFTKTSIQFTDKIGAGELTDVMVNQPARIGIALRFFATLIASIAVLVSYISILAIVSPLLLVFAVGYTIATTLVFRTLTKRMIHGVGSELSQANVEFSQIFFETMNGAKLIRLSGATNSVQREVEFAVKKLERAKDKTVAVENMTVPFFSTMGGILICLIVMVVGVINTETAAQSVGVLVIFFVLLLRILSPLSLISISRNNIVIHLDAFRKLDSFLTNSVLAIERDGNINIERFRESICLNEVTFSYGSEGEKKALDRLSFRVAKGSMVAIVGPSGGGKSTIVNLIARLYRPCSGRIYVDEHDLSDLVEESWWRLLGVVSQEVVLVNDTIRANLCFGLREEVSDERLRQAVRLAAIDDWIEGLPGGYETVLGDRGARLSGGQRQRVALARVFLKNPDIVILDEATSALDTLTERVIQTQLLSWARGKTVIVIAHRLSTVRRADMILLVHNGRLAESGTHAELIAQRGMYWQMTETQSLELVEEIATIGAPANGG